jgi:DNA-binding transcriptional ArsR family regulator
MNDTEPDFNTRKKALIFHHENLIYDGFIETVTMMPNMTEFFKALSDTTRQRIVYLLLHTQSLHVNEFCQILSVPQSKVSRHLTILRNAGWVVFNRRDKRIFYRIDPDIDPEFLTALKKLFSKSIEFETDLKNLHIQY